MSDTSDNFFDLGGARDDVVAALDASIAANPDGVLLSAKQWVRGIFAAGPDQWVGCTLRWFDTPTDGYTITASFCTAPAHPSVMAEQGA